MNKIHIVLIRLPLISQIHLNRFSDYSQRNSDSVGSRRLRTSDFRRQQHLRSIEEHFHLFIVVNPASNQSSRQRDRVRKLHDQLVRLRRRTSVVVQHEVVDVGAAERRLRAALSRVDQKHLVRGRRVGETEETGSHGIQGKTSCHSWWEGIKATMSIGSNAFRRKAKKCKSMQMSLCVIFLNYFT